MDRSKRITVAIPTCNGARHLREAMIGLLDQGNDLGDVIVSDDRSDDDTLAIVREILKDRARVSINSERLGLAGNWNRCVELSRTEWIAIFHQDDVMHPGHLLSHRALIESYGESDLGLVAGPVDMIDELGRPVSPRLIHPGGLRFRSIRGVGPTSPGIYLPPDSLLASLSTENPFRCSAVTIRKKAHKAVGGFDPLYRYAVDWDFWIRISRAWGCVWSTEPATVDMRWHDASETHRFKMGTADLDEQVRLLDRLHEGEVTGQRSRKTADDRLARAFLNRAHVTLKAGNVLLARDCLLRSLGRSRKAWWTMAGDPRLAIQMATLILAPEWAKYWFGASPRSELGAADR